MLEKDVNIPKGWGDIHCQIPEWGGGGDIDRCIMRTNFSVRGQICIIIIVVDNYYVARCTHINDARICVLYDQT